MKKTVITLLFLAVFLSAAGEDDCGQKKKYPGPEINKYWVMLQFIPSPQWFTEKGGDTRFALRWQVTPLLYSWGRNRSVSPWRFLMAEPAARQSGSAEIFFSPEYLKFSRISPRWQWRGGLRIYLPAMQKGEYLSFSGAVSYFKNAEKEGLSYEAGIYTMSGLFGLQVTYSPEFNEALWIYTLSVRLF
jgi:hypothetical protein